jgi:hypothetical protein
LIAYNIWEQEGCCNGHDCEHWLRAEAIWAQKQKPAAGSGVSKAESKHDTKPNKNSNFNKNRFRT